MHGSPTPLNLYLQFGVYGTDDFKKQVSMKIKPKVKRDRNALKLSLEESALYP